MSEKPKIIVGVIKGNRLTCFKDPLVVCGEWVINGPQITKRLSARRWSRTDVMDIVADLENQYLQMKKLVFRKKLMI